MLPTDPPPAALRAQLEHQLQAVVGMLDDADLDALLDLAIARFVAPAPTAPCPDGVDLHQVGASLAARRGWSSGSWCATRRRWRPPGAGGRVARRAWRSLKPTPSRAWPRSETDKGGGV